MTYQDLWRAIDKMAADNKLSCSRMAKNSGLDATIFNKSKRISSNGKPHCMSMQSVMKVLNYLNVNMAYFAKYVDNE